VAEDSRGDGAASEGERVTEVDLATHRSELLRHAYRMLGSYPDAEDVVQDVLLNAWKARDQYRGDVPVSHWLMRIATNRCLDEIARRRRRGLPNLERDPQIAIEPIEQLEAADWVTPAPDAMLETREHVALAFIALLQRLPPKQRAALLLKDVVGWAADEIANALGLSLGATNSALHRAREALAQPLRPRDPEPTPELVREYIRSWEERDLDALLALLRDDVTLAMPPHATWFQGATVGEFLRSERFAGFWTRGSRLVPTRANGQLAFVFYRGDGIEQHSVQLVAFRAGKVAEMIQFIGPAYLRGFAP
jgi:RNA polymerase sigma-70 factor (ECF subfamily)